MLKAQKTNNGNVAWQQRLNLEKDLKEAGKSPEKVATDVIKPFLDKAIDENNRWLGLSQTSPMATMGTYQDYSIDNMVDGDPSTLYWSNAAAKSGDSVGVDLGNVYSIKNVKLLMGSTEGSMPRPDDYIHHGALEYSRDGEKWKNIMTGNDQREIDVNTDGIKARYIRYRVTESQTNWVQVREFQVESDKGQIQVNGAPPAAEGSSLSAAADEKIMTVYRAARKPNKDEALTFTFSRTGKLNQAIILQDVDSPAKAKVQIQNKNGDWETVGELSGSYTNINIGKEAESLRLLWEEGSPPPMIHEVIPKWENQDANVIVAKDAVASSSETSEWTPDKAIDQDPATRWSSGRSDNEWIYVDLGETYTINKVKLDWETAYGKGYEIQVSNDAKNWTTVYSTTTGDGGIDDIHFDPVKARYVRMQGTERATVYGYSLWEFQVFRADTTSPELTTMINGKPLGEEVTVPNTDTVKFTWEAKDEESGLAKVSAVFDGELYEEGTEIDLAGKPGKHELTVTAVDKAGNVKKQTYVIHVTTSADDMKKIVQRFKDDGEIKTDDAANSLNIHLSAVRLYENRNMADKVVKHMKTFKILLDYQKDNISDDAYQTLKVDSDYLIRKWQ